MFVIAGLGNPGKDYEYTRHNMGFLVVDELAERHGIRVNKIKYHGLLGDGTIAGQKVLLVKPLTYMNLSGECIGEVLRFYKVPPENFLVIYDDISLPIGGVRMREKGSAGGHNGVKSLIQHLGTDAFPRIKVGVGEKPAGWDLADHVLSRFPAADGPRLEEAIDRAVKGVELFLQKGPAVAMSRTNYLPPQEKPEPKSTGNEEGK